MPANVARANGAKSRVRAAVEHVFARQKGPMGLVVRTIGLARARVKIGMANLVYNMNRAVWLTQHRAHRVARWLPKPDPVTRRRTMPGEMDLNWSRR